jgi:hypothetical protein
MSGALPHAARWPSGWNDAVATSVEARLLAEDDDPERWAPEHRFEAVTLATSAADDVAVTGRAVPALVEAAAALREAFATGDAGRIVEASARVATGCADLADPFLTTPLDLDEAPGARAAFSDVWDATALGDLVAAPASSVDLEDAAMALALGSATRRATIEAAVAAGDDATVAAIRRERLEAALALAQAIARDAWSAAGAPALESAPAAGRARVWPNPVRATTRVSFTLAASGPVRAELFDLAGRRVWSRELATLAAGPQTLTLGHGDLQAIPPGIYLARITGVGTEATARLSRVAP